MRAFISPNPVHPTFSGSLSGLLAAIGLTVCAFQPFSALAQVITTGDVRQHNQAADAQFGQFTGCSSSSVFVQASDVQQRGSIFAPANTSNAFVSIFQFDFCGPQPIFRSVSASTVLPDDGFVLNGNLDSATLKATLSGFDFTSGRNVVIAVDLQWKGANEVGVARSRTRFESETGSGKQKQQFIGTSRPMTASGSVTIDGDNITPNESTIASVRDEESRNNFTFQQ